MIRELMREDMEAAIQLLRQLWPGKRIDPALVAGIIEEYVHAPGYWAYVYEEEGALKGMVTVTFRWTLFRLGKVAIIESLVVDQGQRGQGIGRALVTFVERKALEGRRVHAIEVSSDLHREDAHIFWKKCGYSPQAFQFTKEVALV
jgi:GNAT superfamily N-acetyltransferase